MICHRPGGENCFVFNSHANLGYENGMGFHFWQSKAKVSETIIMKKTKLTEENRVYVMFIRRQKITMLAYMKQNTKSFESSKQKI